MPSISGLTVPRVEFLARRLVVVEQMQNKVLWPLKTKASRRVVPLDDLVLNAITAHTQRWHPGPGRARRDVRPADVRPMCARQRS
jgi:hypothetical protein